MQAKGSISFLLVISCLICASCTGIRISGFDFERLFDPVPGSSVIIRNNTDADIVLFKENVHSVNDALGGVRAGQAWGINKIAGCYLIKVVTEADLVQNERNPSNCRIISAFLVYVDDVQTTYTVTSADPGSGMVFLKNESQRYVEVKLDDFYNGSTLTYVLPREERIQYLPYDDYRFCPIYLTIQTNGTKIIGITRRFNTAAVSVTGIYPGENIKTITIGSEAGQRSDVTIYIKNLTPVGASFMYGGTIQKSTLGREILNANGGTQTYVFNTGTPTWYFGENTIYLIDHNYVPSAAYAPSMDTQSGAEIFLVYSGAFASGTWTKCDTLTEFNAAQ
ncbi:MAG: DUF4925 domain-containing protein [Spirochaetota bacterium]|jgi:hypothetical protein|nr:DUF4925 domain-containing protein [Spirochaetota bacterium]